MRQAGILAAAGSWALENNIDRLGDDHDNARRFAQGVDSIQGVKLINSEVETNLVFFDIEETGMPAKELVIRLREHGVYIGDNGGFQLRAVTHLGVDQSAVDEATQLIKNILAR